MTDAEKKRKEKKQKDAMEAQIFKVVEKSLQSALDKALDDIMKDWK